MKFLRDKLDAVEPLFLKGGKLEQWYALFEMADTFLFTPGLVTEKGAHIRDYLDQKRMMITVAFALGPAMMFGVYNIGYQAAVASEAGAELRTDWQTELFTSMGFVLQSGDHVANVMYGLAYFIPIFLVVHIVGGFWEGLFATVRKHEINEGFLVTGALFPLLCPPTIPLWQVALGITFGVVVGKELFGGTGRNVLNPALTGRAFLFFAYPAEISGDKVWIAAADSWSGATHLGSAAVTEGYLATQNWMDAFIGFVPGSIGEVSAVACLAGALLLIVTRVGSWHVIVAGLVGTACMAFLLNAIGSETNPMFDVPFHWHIVLGGYAFGLAFMATDPVSSSYTCQGKLAYGFLIGVLVVLIRVVNPAYPEGMMLAILFMNLFAPLLDHFVVQRNIKRRLARYAA
ncbi:MAG: NADH:ubiquinone reductase (Na(+)-transporting) subunit B [Proteobacteria bacterium]|nr:NADH:ubiquinone reductase (Na(+)-transporting) subunit B [Pseudomonadota bacterium]MCP4920969.1 NADH:ubiquinone reductase (Na(+)-transporting) subunit B [Pseudomonadota bacterium]